MRSKEGTSSPYSWYLYFADSIPNIQLVTANQGQGIDGTDKLMNSRGRCRYVNSETKQGVLGKCSQKSKVCRRNMEMIDLDLSICPRQYLPATEYTRKCRMKLEFDIYLFLTPIGKISATFLGLRRLNVLLGKSETIKSRMHVVL